MRFSRPAAMAVAALTTLSLATGASAAQRQPAASPASREATAVSGAAQMDAEETRRSLEDVLKQYPPSLPRILKMDPSLLTNDGYLQPYPQLAGFLKQHGEIAHNPSYFLSEYSDNTNSYYRQTPQDRAVDMWRSTIQGFTIGAVILGIATGVIWLIKMLVDYRRWSRLSKIHTEVHNKLLDRMQSNEDLLAYIQTPAGRRFLESAPIAIDSPRSIGAPLGRILWSSQAGAVLTVLGLGIEIVAHSTVEEVAPPLAALGAVVIALGIGFLVSALLAFLLTRRFGLLTDPGQAPESRG